MARPRKPTVQASLTPIQAQLLLNAGLVWQLEGPVGYAAVERINEGSCMLGPASCTDAHGNTVPSRTQIKPGMRGTREFVVAAFGEDHALELELLPSEPTLDILSIALF